MNYNYNIDYSGFDSLFGGFSILLIVLTIIVLAWVVVTIIALWKVYKKAGKNGWECIIPFYSYYVLTEIAEINWWWFLLAVLDSIISLVNLDDLSSIATLVSLFAKFNIYYNIAKKFNKNNGTAICAGILSGIFILIFGFSKDEVYDANIPVSKNGVFGTPETSTNNYSNQNNDMNHQFNNNVFNSTNNTNVSNTNTNGFSFCGNCGTKLNENVKFCPNCGKENK